MAMLRYIFFIQVICFLVYCLDPVYTLRTNKMQTTNALRYNKQLPNNAGDKTTEKKTSLSMLANDIQPGTRHKMKPRKQLLQRSTNVAFDKIALPTEQ